MKRDKCSRNATNDQSSLKLSLLFRERNARYSVGLLRLIADQTAVQVDETVNLFIDAESCCCVVAKMS